jgi:purine-binding chemotaxis protein CheW
MEIAGMSTAISSSTEKQSPGTGDGRGHEFGRTAGAATEFISFAIDHEQYGVDIMAVREIKGWTGVTHLPNQPDYMRGVLNLRGTMVPIIDLRCRFGQGLTEAGPTHVVIVVQVGIKTVGLLADQVLDIIAVDAEQIQPVPQVSKTLRADFLSGLVTTDTTMTALIDLSRLFVEQSEIEAENLVTA